MTRHNVFVTGGTGYVGRPLISQLLKRGHSVSALARERSVRRLPEGCEAVVGNALDRATFVHRVRPCDTFVQLVGTPKPNPVKARQFQEIDLVSARESVAAAVEAGVQHFVYVSVAQPAPVMKAYVAVRAEVERIIHTSGFSTTILRPWYVLGPGHRWPYVLLPIYWVMERLPTTRDGALRMGLVTLDQLLAALVAAVEDPAETIRIVSVPQIRAAA